MTFMVVSSPAFVIELAPSERMRGRERPATSDQRPATAPVGGAFPVSDKFSLDLGYRYLPRQRMTCRSPAAGGLVTGRGSSS
ncbi:MAG: hypothetical protein C0481_07930 [Phenylobacterium sp.]|nr:hypothetical protein [Phenylobacterium sp.]